MLPLKEAINDCSPGFLVSVEVAIDRYYGWLRAESAAGDCRYLVKVDRELLSRQADNKLREFKETGAQAVTREYFGEDMVFIDLGGTLKFTLPIPDDEPLADRVGDGRIGICVFDKDNSLPSVDDSEDALREYLSNVKVGDSDVKLVAIPGIVLEWYEGVGEKYEKDGYVFYLVELGDVVKLNDGIPQTATGEVSFEGMCGADF